MKHPTIGITVDNRDNQADSGTYESAIRYSAAVAEAGGLPVLLPHEVALAGTYVRLCDGLLLTGGGDPVMEQFGCATDGRARRIDQRRQEFELALLKEVDAQRDAGIATNHDMPVLGVCLGMQLMALYHQATLDQYMPESMGEEPAGAHYNNNRHTLAFDADDSVLPPAGGTVVSSHRQRISSAGKLRVVARAEDQTIEAIDDPTRHFYLGVQWHPERCDEPGSAKLNRQLIRRFVDAARSQS